MLNHSIKLINVTQFGGSTALVLNGVFIAECDDNGSFDEAFEFESICDNLAEALNAPTPIPIIQYTPLDDQWNWDEVVQHVNREEV